MCCLPASLKGRLPGSFMRSCKFGYYGLNHPFLLFHVYVFIVRLRYFFQLRFMIALNSIYNAKIFKASLAVMICLQGHFFIECHLMSFIDENCRIRVFLSCICESTRPKKVQDMIGNCFFGYLSSIIGRKALRD